MLPRITTFGWVPEFARGFVRDMRPRWAFEEVGQRYAVKLITDAKSRDRRRLQPFGQVPTYQDDEVAIFKSVQSCCGSPNMRANLFRRIAPPVCCVATGGAALNTVEPYVMALFINDVDVDEEWSKGRMVVSQALDSRDHRAGVARGRPLRRRHARAERGGDAA